MRWSPDFGRLPPGTRAEFAYRLDRLPLNRVTSKIDADAVVHNERRFFDEFCIQHQLGSEDVMVLLNWHLGSVMDRLSVARPDLVPPRPAGGDPRPIGRLVVSRGERLRFPLLRSRLSFVMGWPSWFRNRWADVREIWVRRRAAEFRRADS